MDIGVYGMRGVPSTYGGFETFVSALLPELSRRGHRVTAYCRSDGWRRSDRYGSIIRKYVPVPASKQLETLSHGALAWLWARLRRHDVVLVCNVANAPFCLLARISGQPVVLNPDGQEWLRGKWGRAGRGYFLASARLARRAASAVVTDSVRMQEIYADRFATRSSVIPYCWTGIEPVPAHRALADLGVRPYEYFVAAARLNPENNVSAVATSYARAGVSFPLLVLGSANYRSPVEERLRELAAANPNIRPLGHISDRELFASLLCHAAAYVHGHSVGGINPGLIEAMGSGANILAFDTPFNREALGPAGGYFSDFERELPQLLAKVAATPQSEGAERREAAARRARDIFGLEAVADAYERLLREVAARPAWSTTVQGTRWRPSDVGAGCR